MTDELKPVRCGCGGEAKIVKSRLGPWFIYCDKCKMCSGYYDSEAEAVTAWNRAMRRAKVDIILNTIEDHGPMPFCPHCGDELEWE